MIQLARDKDTGELKTIYEVRPGIECGCICSCGQDLIAKNKGKSIDKPLLLKQKNAFFAHKGDCKYNGETTIHLLAKEVLKKNKKLRIYSLIEKEFGLITKSEIIEFDSVETEQNYPNDDLIRPDATLKKGDKALFVEFYVTHSVDKDKTGKIKRIAESAIEIDLNFIGFDPIKDDKPNFHEMQIFLENYPERDSKWICNLKRDDLIRRKIISQKQRVTEASKAYDEKSKEYKIVEAKYNESIKNYYETNVSPYKEQYWTKGIFTRKMLGLGCELIRFGEDNFNVYAICPYITLQNAQRQEKKKMRFEDCLKCDSHHKIETYTDRPFCSYKAELKQKEEIKNIILEEQEKIKRLKIYSDSLNEFKTNEYKLLEKKLGELKECETKLKNEESRLEKLTYIK